MISVVQVTIVVIVVGIVSSRSTNLSIEVVVLRIILKVQRMPGHEIYISKVIVSMVNLLNFGIPPIVGIGKIAHAKLEKSVSIHIVL